MNKLLVVLACAISLSGSAKAAIVKFQYTGTVSAAMTDSPDGYIWGTAHINGYPIMTGNTVTGTVTYDTSNPIWRVRSNSFVSYQGYGEITATVPENGFSIATTSADHHQMNVGNDSGLYQGSSDFLGMSAVSADANGAPVRLVDFFLYDDTGTAFDSWELPAQLDLGRFGQADLTVSYINGDYWTQFSATITSLELTTEVPEPASPALLFAGLGVMLGARRYMFQKHSRTDG